MYSIAFDNPWSFRWCTNTALLPFEGFRASVWHQTRLRLVIIQPRSGEVRGAAVFWTFQEPIETLNLDVPMKLPLVAVEFWEGLSLALGYWAEIDVARKVFLNIPASIYSELRDGIDPRLIEEGRLKDFFWINGKADDLVCISTNRSDWLLTV